MKETAAKHGIHLAGSLMLRDGGEIYNALLLLAPDGRTWRYGKRYPWGWERAYFRAGRSLTVADTDLGDIGLMICWDAAHRKLWRGYAGQVDLVLISSCPPDVTNPTYYFPDGDAITLDDFGPVGGVLKNTGRRLFGPMINAQTAWLGVPAVVTVGCGHLRTPIPRGRATLLSYLALAPHLIKYLPQAEGAEVECDFVRGCKIVAADGEVITELSQEEGESFAVADVTLADEKPGPTRPQPQSLLPWLTYLSSDVVLPSLMRPFYRRGVRNLLR
jgi:predicted amidohydrolase